jgi:hypothetical protein
MAPRSRPQTKAKPPGFANLCGVASMRPRRNGFAARCEEAATPFRQSCSLKLGLCPRWGIAPKLSLVDGEAKPPPHIGRQSRCATDPQITSSWRPFHRAEAINITHEESPEHAPA